MPLRARASRFVLSLPLAVALASCKDPAPPAPTPATPPAPATAAPKGDPAPTTKVTLVPAEPPKVAPAEMDAPAGEDWLVTRQDAAGQWITRWVDASDAETIDVAERKALVLSDGQRLWLVERQDAEVDVAPCECEGDVGDEGMGVGAPTPACKPNARIAALGLRATELGSGKVTGIHGPPAHPPAKPGVPEVPLVGEGISRSLLVRGGAGSLLFYQWNEDGYFCGAHGVTASGDVVFDLVTGEAVADAWKAVDTALPVPLRTTAAKEIHATVSACEGEGAVSLEEVRDEQMKLSGIAVALVDGEPTVTWSFHTDTYYACSADYAAHGQVSTKLLSAGAAMGLEGPLPAGVRKVLAEIGTAPVVGWARLSLEGKARKAAIEAFGRAAEGSWPAEAVSDRPLAAPESQQSKDAKAAVEEGRRLTRAGELAAAIERYDAAIELDPKLPRAWSERGYARLLAGDLEAAKADLDAALPLDEGAGFRASVRYNLGQVAEKQGLLEVAAAEYEASLALREHEGVRKALARVKPQ